MTLTRSSTIFAGGITVGADINLNGNGIINGSKYLTTTGGGIKPTP